MKTNGLSLKSALRVCLLAAFLLAGVFGFTRSHAQSIVMPTINDFFMTNPGDGYPNTANIDYSPFCNISMPCWGTKRQLTALVSDDGANPMLYVDDQAATPVPWISRPIPVAGGCAPDVVVGNDLSTTGAYIVGVVVNTGGNIVLYLYQVTNVGTGALALGAPYSVTTISGRGTASGPAHIDVAGQYSTSYMGLPMVNRFIITWKDNVTGIMAYFASLNAPAPGLTQVINPGTNFSSPDVAAVERAGGSIWGLFSYVDQTVSPNILVEQEWMVGAAPLAATIYDNTKIYLNPFAGASVARIDAIDDFNFNRPGAGNAYFCIAASAPSPVNSVWEYNNITGVLNGQNITAPVTLPHPGLNTAINQLPVVACGPGPYYTVGYYSAPTMGGGQQGYFATAVNWGTGMPTTDPNAYMINKQSYDPSFLPGLGISATCNTDNLGTQDLFCGFENYQFLLFKYSTAVAGYVFKPAPAAVQAVVANGEWKLFPNPASDQVTLSAPASFKTTDCANYTLSDLTGKAIVSGAISNSSEEINVSALPAGTYFINITNNESTAKTLKFVKD